MTHLRKMMLEELQRRNYAQSTAEAYILALKQFAAYRQKSPDRLGPKDINQFQFGNSGSLCSFNRSRGPENAVAPSFPKLISYDGTFSGQSASNLLNHSPGAQYHKGLATG